MKEKFESAFYAQHIYFEGTENPNLIPVHWWLKAVYESKAIHSECRPISPHQVNT